MEQLNAVAPSRAAAAPEDVHVAYTVPRSRWEGVKGTTAGVESKTPRIVKTKLA